MLNLDKTKIRILIVDDTLKNIQVLGTVLKQEGYQINVAQNGKQALKLAEQVLPDLILLDIMMPEMDGFETCIALKALPQTAEIPIIFLTARTETESIVQGFQLGAVDYITKPFNATELLVRVQTHLSLKKSKDMLYHIGNERKELLHILCHDLANPMHSIISVLDIMHNSDDFVQMRGFLLEAVKQGLDIIDLVRQMRALEERRLKLSRVELSPLIEVSHTILRQRLEQKNLSLELSLEPGLCVCVEEVSFINSVINNLLTNAIKFSHPSSVIHLAAHALDSEWVQLSLTDHGIGMPPSLLENLFDVSKTTSREGTSGEQGTGFGMPLVQRFILAYGGEIQVTSQSIKDFPHDHGTCVRLRLPQSCAPPLD
jgi:two-component system, sensor histidine kinase and response regulator